MTATTTKTEAPWQAPELVKSPEFIFDTLRETQYMVNNLTDKVKKLKAEIHELHGKGQLAHLVDDENSNKYNGSGVSVTLCSGKKKRVWQSRVQEQLDELQAQMDKIKLQAEAARLYTEEEGPKSWRVSLQKPL